MWHHITLEIDWDGSLSWQNWAVHHSRGSSCSGLLFTHHKINFGMFVILIYIIAYNNIRSVSFHLSYPIFWKLHFLWHLLSPPPQPPTPARFLLNHAVCSLLEFSLLADKWQISANVTPAAGGLHTCYYHQVNESTQVGVELEGSLRTRECTTTVGYQIDLPSANLVFRGRYTFKNL